MRVSVSEYYQTDLFRLMPEDMFDLLDEAYFYKRPKVKIPDRLIETFEKNKEKDG
jgi:hypothetical protein